MDPALLRERELFKKRALTTPTVEKRKTESKSEPVRDDKKKPKASTNSAPKLDINTYKTATGSSQYRFGVLAKIVKHMRTRHQEGDQHPLTLEEILDETNQLDVGTKVKMVVIIEYCDKNDLAEVAVQVNRFFQELSEAAILIPKLTLLKL